MRDVLRTARGPRALLWHSVCVCVCVCVCEMMGWRAGRVRYSLAHYARVCVCVCAVSALRRCPCHGPRARGLGASRLRRTARGLGASRLRRAETSARRRRVHAQDAHRGDVVTFFDYTLTELDNLRIFSCERRRICQYPMTPVTHGGRRFGKLKTFWVTRHWNFLCDRQTDTQTHRPTYRRGRDVNPRHTHTHTPAFFSLRQSVNPPRGGRGGGGSKNVVP